MTTNTKAIIDKNKRYILNLWKGQGGATGFVKAVDLARERYKGRWGLATPYNAIYQMFYSDGYGEVYTVRQAEYLKRLGLTNEKKLWATDIRPAEIYCSLMARDGTKLYEQLKTKGVTATKKAISVKKKKKPAPFGL